MKRIIGKTVYKAVALGKIHVMKKTEITITNATVNDADAEWQRVKDAIALATEQLQNLYEQALEKVGDEHAMIFQVHQMMLEDEDYLEAIEGMICSENFNAEYAVNETGKTFSEMFAAMDDEYMKARSADVKDISDRIVRCLSGVSESGNHFENPVIIVADDLTPSETVTLDKSKILAFVTVHGSTNSHTAILARTMNIPALIGVDVNLDELTDGTLAIVDGNTGEFVLEPDEELQEITRKAMEEQAKQRELLQDLKGKENITLSGKKINLYANIGNVEDAESAIENDAGGIGLFRSEFLYIGRNNLPSEEEQFESYKAVAEKMAGKKVIIRTLDIGADKQADYLNLGKEENPALGYRAIRICLTQKEIFKTQLRALYRAAVYGNISIMYPMIISTDEVEQIKAISAEVKAELAKENIPYKDVEEGIMIETPAAVMLSDKLAGMVDFFSIGTNDLTQYTLAIDRQNANLDAFYNPHHEAVLRMIEMATVNAHKAGIWIGICGELGADTELTETFINMGVDELSVAPGAILGLRKIIREMN